MRRLLTITAALVTLIVLPGVVVKGGPNTGAINTFSPITVLGEADGQAYNATVAAADTGAAASTCLPDSTSIAGCNDAPAFTSAAKTNSDGSAHTALWLHSGNAVNTDGTSQYVFEKNLDGAGFVYVARFRERSAGSDGGGAAADFDVNGLITMTDGSWGVAFVGIEEQNLAVGNCLLGAIVLDTGGATRELCFCTGASATPATGNIWTCIDAPTEVGPKD